MLCTIANARGFYSGCCPLFFKKNRKKRTNCLDLRDETSYKSVFFYQVFCKCAKDMNRGLPREVIWARNKRSA